MIVILNPPNPASVLEEHERVNYKTKSSEIHERTKAYMSGNKNLFEPRLPASVLESETDVWGQSKFSCGGDCGRLNEDGSYKLGYEPPNPASVLEEKDEFGWDKSVVKEKGTKFKGSNFEPPNPASVLEEDDTVYSKKGWKMGEGFASKDGNKQYLKENPGYTPRQPGSVVEEELIEPAEDEPYSMFESKKVFIGKRHHQTEKPLDILEFFIKYWTDEGHTILDPTMGSGSTGVACKTLKRNFIGFEMDEKIFKVAEGRIKKVEVII